MTYKLVYLPGDGIGPEVLSEVAKLVNWLDANTELSFETEEFSLGGASYDEHGTPLSDAALQACHAADAVIMGAIGGPKWDGKVPYDKRPEAGLLRLRTEMGLYCNLRVTKVFDALINASTLKPEIIQGLNILFVRELCGGIYFNEPKEMRTDGNGVRTGVDTQAYSEPEIERIARRAFEFARSRGKKVTSIDKANVLQSSILWREIVTDIHHKDFADIALNHMYVDNTAMQIVRNPKQFDVILVDNQYGDILSDASAMLSGSLGMLPSAAIGEPGKPGLYEPVHGSAPDIAGQNVVNPLATILSFAMALRYSLGQPVWADRVEKAVEITLNEGYRTADIMSPGCHQVSTTQMGDALITCLSSAGN